MNGVITNGIGVTKKYRSPPNNTLRIIFAPNPGCPAEIGFLIAILLCSVNTIHAGQQNTVLLMFVSFAWRQNEAMVTPGSILGFTSSGRNPVNKPNDAAACSLENLY
jgi:hypothetical protein